MHDRMSCQSVPVVSHRSQCLYNFPDKLETRFPLLPKTPRVKLVDMVVTLVTLFKKRLSLEV